MEKTKKFSRKREAIYNTICSTKSHPSAEWVCAKVREQYPDISLGTVYRNISCFKAENAINSVAVVNGQERVDGDISEHSHFVCDICGDVIDIDGPTLTWEYGVVSEKSGCKVDRHSLVFYGVCEKCKTPV